MTRILGLADSHNGAACILEDGAIGLAVQEERLTRKKRAAGYSAAAEYVLEGELPDLVVLCPLHDARSAATKLAAHPTLGSVPSLVVSHHRAHAAAALAQSGWDDATVLVIDGAGSLTADLAGEERALDDREGREIVSIYRAEQGVLTPLHKQVAPKVEPVWREGMMPFTSLGVMYQSVALQIFGHWDAAGKVMGLAPYGTPRRSVEQFLSVENGRLSFGEVDVRGAERWPSREREYMDLAAETQQALELGVLELAKWARKLGHDPRSGRTVARLCYAGGVALNSVANMRIIQEAGFRDVFIMPASEDNGTAIGAAVLGWQHLGHRFSGSAIGEDALGRAYSAQEIDLPNDLVVSRPADVFAATAALLDAGKTVGWFQGRSEFGPRALGQRSILFDPRRSDGKERLNRLKKREAFRPFAPAILEERAAEWFEESGQSPFMLQVWRFRPDKAALVPAVVHVDGTGRVQTVRQGRLRRLIEAFERRTGVPLILNTSFNVAGEPMVETPEDAVRGFLDAGLDALVLEDRLVSRR